MGSITMPMEDTLKPARKAPSGIDLRAPALVHVCRFSAGLDDLSRKEQADPATVLRTLKRLGRYSCFEASDNRVIAKTMDSLQERKLLVSSCGAYPWSTCTVTPLGDQFLQDGILPPLPDPFEGMVRISKTVYVHKTIADRDGLHEYIPPTSELNRIIGSHPPRKVHLK